MTTPGPESVNIKTMRQQILRNLNYVYPSGLTARHLFQTVCSLNPLYDINLLCKDTYYLFEKHYVSFVDAGLGGMPSFEDKVVKLTAAGKDIADKTKTDPTLEI